MNDGPKYDATDVVPSICVSPGSPMSGRPALFMYCVATWPSKMFLKCVGSDPWM